MLKIAFTGDLSLCGLKRAPQDTCKDAFNNINQLIGTYDLSIANLECSLSLNAHEKVGMNIPISLFPEINSLGVDVFCLANNHVKDSGSEALVEMTEYVKSSGSAIVGAGINALEAEMPLLLTIDGLSFGILNVTDASHYAATKNEAGVAVLNAKKLIEKARKLSTEVDVVIVIIHSDLEFSNYPAPWRVRLSRRLAKYCHVVIHHHSHTLQGIETVDGCVIAYSLGNFVFPALESDYMKNRAGGITEGIVFVVGIKKDQGKITTSIEDVIPTRIGEFGFLRTLVTEEERNKTLADIKQYTNGLSDTSFLRRNHYANCRVEFKKLLLGTYYAFCRGGSLKAISYINTHLSTDQHRNWLRSFFTFGYF